jgi:hypothetical protein
MENIPGGPEHINQFFDDMMREFSNIHRTMRHVDFSGDFLYEVSKRYPPKETNLAALTGISFRLSPSVLSKTEPTRYRFKFVDLI